MFSVGTLYRLDGDVDVSVWIETGFTDTCPWLLSIVTVVGVTGIGGVVFIICDEDCGMAEYPSDAEVETIEFGTPGLSAVPGLEGCEEGLCVSSGLLFGTGGPWLQGFLNV